ncbi:MAG: universal stress protein, partial [Bacteroidetes bacterium]|nr:universal stress protein [Bacteroidota bacterium]
VDFSLNTEIAINKAGALLGRDKAILHLAHVIHPRTPSAAQRAVENALEDLREHTSLSLGLIVKAHLLKSSSVQNEIIECANMLNPDLIIIGKQHPHHRWWPFQVLSPHRLAQKTNCPVLTAKPGSIDNRTKVIVIPIRDFLPERKLEWGVLLARKYKAQIHLLAIQEHQHTTGMPQTFLQAYHHLREQLQHPIEFSATSRQSPALATLNYAELIMADMIVLTPQSESGISGSRHISDLLKPDSKIQVLDLEPYK